MRFLTHHAKQSRDFEGEEFQSFKISLRIRLEVKKIKMGTTKKLDSLIKGKVHIF